MPHTHICAGSVGGLVVSTLRRVASFRRPESRASSASPGGLLSALHTALPDITGLLSVHSGEGGIALEDD